VWVVGWAELVGDLTQRAGQGMDLAAFPAGAARGGGLDKGDGCFQQGAERFGIPGVAGGGQRSGWNGRPVDAVTGVAGELAKEHPDRQVITDLVGEVVRIIPAEVSRFVAARAQVRPGPAGFLTFLRGDPEDDQAAAGLRRRYEATGHPVGANGRMGDHACHRSRELRLIVNVVPRARVREARR